MHNHSISYIINNMCIYTYITFSIVIISIIILLLKWVYIIHHTPKKNLPPSPPKLPLLGNLHQLGKSPHRSLHSISKKYGDFVLIHLGSKPTLAVSSASAAREIMKTHDTVFANRPKTSTISKLCYDGKDIAFSNYGEYWRQMKSVCVLRLLSNAKVRSFRTIREEEMEEMVAKIKRTTPPNVVNVGDVVMGFTNDVICRAAFGRKYSGDKGRNFNELVKCFQDVLGSFSEGDFVPWLSWLDIVNGLRKKVEKVGKGLDEILEGIIEEHVVRHANCGVVGNNNGEKNKDFVDELLEVQRENSVGFSIDRENIKALILDMFAAGTDTSYTAVEWAMSELLKHPNILRELQNEVRTIAQYKEGFSECDLDKMRLLKAVIKETLRLHPPDPLLVFRESSQDVTINGYDIARCTQVIINAWAIHRDPSFWDNPNEFCPNRFMNSPIDFKGQDNFQFIPFGAGRRSCPGVSFATISMEFVLANLVNTFDWALPPDVTPETLNMDERNGIIIHRRHSLLAVATPVYDNAFTRS